MLPTIIAVFVILAALIVWAVYTQRKLAALDENVRSALNQLGVQLSGRFDALTALLELAKGCDGQQGAALMERVKVSRSTITAKATPEDVRYQERVLSCALGSIALLAAQYPALGADPRYQKAMGAAETFEGMVRTSRLIYNDAVTKLNRRIRPFPVSVLACVLGFPKRAYLEEQAQKRTEEICMGLFSKKPPCPVCGGKIGWLLPAKIEGEYVCSDCFGKLDIQTDRIAGLSMQGFRDYLAFYEQNRFLKARFSISERIDFGFLSSAVIFDYQNKLFCLSAEPDKTVFEGSCLNSFVIREDGALLIEGSASGVRRHESPVPERARLLAPQIARYIANRQMARLADRLDDGKVNNSAGNMPYANVPEPFRAFKVELRVDHPYWSVIEFEVSGPTFSNDAPDVNLYLHEYQNKVDALLRLAEALRQVAFPSAQGAYGSMSGTTAQNAPLDAAEELKKFKALMDTGVITPGEFDAKKRQLLGI